MGITSIEAMKNEIVGGEKKTAHGDPLMQREWTFHIHHVDPRGDVFDGDFTNQILNFSQISQVGALMARMSMGSDAASLDAFTSTHNEKLAHLSISLVKRPDWANDLGELFDLDLLDAIYKEVSRHEATFSGRRKAEGDGDGGDDRVKDAVVVEEK